jgi:multidrug resistance protein, MATE family
VLKTNYSTILKVAFPLMIGNFIQSIVLITDMAFIARIEGDSTVYFDAAGNAGLLYITIYMIAAGFGDGLQITKARFIGENSLQKIPYFFQTGLVSLLFFAIIFFSLIQWFTPTVLNSISNDQAITNAQIDFLSIRSYALFFSLTSLAMMSFLLATGKTQIVFVSSILMSSVNILLDYCLIFGKWGLPEMGLDGAALASVIAEITVFLFFTIYFLNRKWIKEYKLVSKISVNLNSLFVLLKIGWPLMLQGFVTLGTWTVFFFWIEQIGRHELEISQNIRSVYFLAFVPIFGFAATTKTYISQLIGAKNFKEIPLVQKRIQLLVTLTLILFFHGALLYPEALISLINPNADVLAESVSIVMQVSPAIYIFGLTSVYFNTVAGSGNTLGSLGIEVLSTGIYLFFAYLFIKVFTFSIHQIWFVEYIYFSVLGILSLLYIRFFNWKQIGKIQ